MSTEISNFATPGQYLVPHLKVFSTEPKIIQKYEPGAGTIIQQIDSPNGKQSVVSATLVGNVTVDEISESQEDDEAEEKEGKKDEVIIKRYKVSVSSSNSNAYKEYNSQTDNSFATNLPKEGDIVLTRVTRLSLKQANVEILAVEGAGNVLKDSGIGSGVSNSSSNSYSVHLASSDVGETFKGIIRSQDVRSTERDKVKIIDCFKPGDIVRAQILSLGDGSNYYLTTARNDLGVVFAKAKNGAGGLMFAIDWQTMICTKTGEVELRKCAKPF